MTVRDAERGDGEDDDVADVAAVAAVLVADECRNPKGTSEHLDVAADEDPVVEEEVRVAAQQA